MTGYEKWATVIAAIVAALTGAGALVALMAAHSADGKAGDANRIAKQANGIAKDAYYLNAMGAERAIASRVFLGEAPPPYTDNGKRQIWSVSNGSGVDVSHVWVEGVNDKNKKRIIRIGESQQCFLYTLGPDTDKNNFKAKKLHFFDGTNHWLRDSDGKLSKDPNPNIPRGLKAGGDAYIHQMVGACGG